MPRIISQLLAVAAVAAVFSSPAAVRGASLKANLVTYSVTVVEDQSLTVQAGGSTGITALPGGQGPPLAVFFAKDQATGLFRLRFQANNRFWYTKEGLVPEMTTDVQFDPDLSLFDVQDVSSQHKDIKATVVEFCKRGDGCFRVGEDGGLRLAKSRENPSGFILKKIKKLKGLGLASGRYSVAAVGEPQARWSISCGYLGTDLCSKGGASVGASQFELTKASEEGRYFLTVRSTNNALAARNFNNFPIVANGVDLATTFHIQVVQELAANEYRVFAIDTATGRFLYQSPFLDGIVTTNIDDTDEAFSTFVFRLLKSSTTQGTPPSSTSTSTLVVTTEAKTTPITPTDTVAPTLSSTQGTTSVSPEAGESGDNSGEVDTPQSVAPSTTQSISSSTATPSSSTPSPETVVSTNPATPILTTLPLEVSTFRPLLCSPICDNGDICRKIDDNYQCVTPTTPAPTTLPASTETRSLATTTTTTTIGPVFVSVLFELPILFSAIDGQEEAQVTLRNDMTRAMTDTLVGLSVPPSVVDSVNFTAAASGAVSVGVTVDEPYAQNIVDAVIAGEFELTLASGEVIRARTATPQDSEDDNLKVVSGEI